MPVPEGAVQPTDANPGNANAKKINLGLQGGGAHGAFTWGVLDYLLEDEHIDIEGISGASAGAMNAVMLADGLARGGPKEARKRLADFWRAASRDGNLSALQRSVMDRLFRSRPTRARRYRPGSTRSRVHVALRPQPVEHQSAARPDRALRRFRRRARLRGDRACSSRRPMCTPGACALPAGQLTADVMMASACLPFLFRAVEIDGVPYWDGGYMGNPAIFPFFGGRDRGRAGGADQSGRAQGDTDTQTEIMNRVNEITFNSSLLAEFRAIDFVTRLIDQGKLPRGTGPKAIPPHQRAPHRARLDVQEADRRLETQFGFRFLRDAEKGRRPAARNFLTEHFDDIGMRSTVDLGAEAKAEWA